MNYKFLLLFSLAFTFPISNTLADLRSMFRNISESEADHYIPSREPVVVYAEKDGRQTNLVRNIGAKREDLATLDGTPRGYAMSPDKNSLAIYYDTVVKLLDMNTKDLRTIIEPRKQICGVNYSPKGDNLMVWDQNCRRSRDEGYYVHQYDIANQTDNIISQDAKSPGGDYFHPYAWRPDNKIILIEIKSNMRVVWVYDLSSKTISPTEYRNPAWVSPDGRYMALPQRQGRRTGRAPLYDPETRAVNFGAANSFRGNYKVIDPVTNDSYGVYGDENRYNSIMGYSPAQNEILYGSSKNRFNKSAREYYRAIMDSRGTEAIASPYSTLEDWNYENIGAEIERKSGDYVIVIGDQAIVSTGHRPNLISQYYTDRDYSKKIPLEPDRDKYRDRQKNHERDYVGRTRNVSIRNGKFIPSTINARVGDRVVWTNKDDVGHTATSDEYGFESGIIIPSLAYGVNIDKSGAFNYHCRLHPEMRGVIRVKDRLGNIDESPQKSGESYLD